MGLREKVMGFLDNEEGQCEVHESLMMTNYNKQMSRLMRKL